MLTVYDDAARESDGTELQRLQQSCNRLQQSCNRLQQMMPPVNPTEQSCSVCNRAATELQQSCNRAATDCNR